MISCGFASISVYTKRTKRVSRHENLCHILVSRHERNWEERNVAVVAVGRRWRGPSLVKYVFCFTRSSTPLRTTKEFYVK